MNNPDKLKLELSVDKDIRKFIEAIQNAYDELASDGRITNKGLSEAVGLDPSFVSRLINGRNNNPNLKTLAKIFRGMDLRLEPNVVRLCDVKRSGRNVSASQVYDEAVWEAQVGGIPGRARPGHLGPSKSVVTRTDRFSANNWKRSFVLIEATPPKTSGAPGDSTQLGAGVYEGAD